jgi:hypothetical protein
LLLLAGGCHGGIQAASCSKINTFPFFGTVRHSDMTPGQP